MTRFSITIASLMPGICAALLASCTDRSATPREPRKALASDRANVREGTSDLRWVGYDLARLEVSDVVSMQSVGEANEDKPLHAPSTSSAPLTIQTSALTLKSRGVWGPIYYTPPYFPELQITHIFFMNHMATSPDEARTFVRKRLAELERRFGVDGLPLNSRGPEGEAASIIFTRRPGDGSGHPYSPTLKRVVLLRQGPHVLLGVMVI